MKKKAIKIIINIFLFFYFYTNISFASDKKNYIFDYETFNEDGTINAIVEIPAGTSEKWEVSKDGLEISKEIYNSDTRVIDYLSYPFNYGFIPQTYLSPKLGGDGDPLDIIIIGSNIKRGSAIKAKPIGTLVLLDKNEIDSKVIALMINDTNISKMNSIDDLEKNYIGLMDIIKTWIINYKGESLELKRVLGKTATKEYIQKYHEAFLNSSKKP